MLFSLQKLEFKLFCHKRSLKNTNGVFSSLHLFINRCFLVLALLCFPLISYFPYAALDFSTNLDQLLSISPYVHNIVFAIHTRAYCPQLRHTRAYCPQLRIGIVFLIQRFLSKPKISRVWLSNTEISVFERLSLRSKTFRFKDCISKTEFDKTQESLLCGNFLSYLRG